MRRRSSRLDGWVNDTTGRGTEADRHASTHYLRPPPLRRDQIEALLETNSIARRLVWRRGEDALRPGYTLEAPWMDPTLHREILDYHAALGVLPAMVHLEAMARGAGGGGIVVVTDDDDPPDQPLRWSTVRRVVRLFVRDRFELVPASAVDLDPASPHFGRPSHWWVEGTTGQRLWHASRVITLDGLPASARTRVERQGWGVGVLDLVFDELRNYGSAHADAAEAIGLLTQGIFEVDNLRELVERGRGDELVERYAALREGMGTLGDIVIDKRHEGYRVETRNFAGLEGLLAAFVRALVTASDMPEVVLIGSRSAGLNGGSEGDDLRGWYDACGSDRSTRYTQPLKRLVALSLVAQSSPTGGLYPSPAAVGWPPMWAPTRGEAAALRSQAAAARAADIAAGVVTLAEARTDRELAEHYTLDASPPLRADEGAQRPGAPVVVDDADADAAHEIDLLWDESGIDPGDLADARTLAGELAIPTSRITRAWRAGDLEAWPMLGGRPRFSRRAVRQLVLAGKARGVGVA